MYTIEFSKKAEKQLYKLEIDIQKKIVRALQKIRIRPWAYVEKLSDDLAYKLRVGDYRVIMDVEKKQLRILVIKVGHRKKIYKK